MTSGKKLAFVILVVAGLLCSILAVRNLAYVYPTPENESAFLKNYSPDSVIEPFKCKDGWAQEMRTTSAGADLKFASHERVFEPRFVIKSKDWMPLMVALEQDMSSQLSLRGAEILSRSGDPREGYRIQYRADKSVGEVAIAPLTVTGAASAPGSRSSLPDDERTVDLHITIQEKWFKSRPGIISVRVSSLKN